MAPSVPNFTLSLCGNFGEETQKRTQQRAMQCMPRMRTLTVLKHLRTTSIVNVRPD
jgi:hypothetical protein